MEERGMQNALDRRQVKKKINGKPEGKISPGRSKHEWDNNIQTNLK
jgi:hypothetical protein